jgi:hypothetical protein
VKSGGVAQVQYRNKAAQLDGMHARAARQKSMDEATYARCHGRSLSRRLATLKKSCSIAIRLRAKRVTRIDHASEDACEQPRYLFSL